MTKVVITAAGKGTRLLPFTKEMPKEMMPIFSKKFTNKKVIMPLLQYVYEQMYSMNFIKMTALQLLAQTENPQHVNFCMKFY